MGQLTERAVGQMLAKKMDELIAEQRKTNELLTQLLAVRM